MAGLSAGVSLEEQRTAILDLATPASLREKRPLTATGVAFLKMAREKVHKKRLSRIPVFVIAASPGSSLTKASRILLALLSSQNVLPGLPWLELAPDLAPRGDAGRETVRFQGALQGLILGRGAG